MYSKLIIGCTLAAASAYGAEIVRRDTGGHGGHDHGVVAAPSSGYSEPAHTSGYAAPAASGYGPTAGATGYEATSYLSDDAGDAFPLSSLLIPILIIAGLSLLFPTITSVAVRRKRDIDSVQSETSPMTEVFERVNDIYMSVVQSEECMERIACEVGGLANEFGMDSYARMAKPFVGGKYKNYLKQFTSGQNCHKIKCGSFN